ncbi:MAG: hypothetical protein WC107_07500 [Patescibacteria group bacterium]
MNYLNNFFTLYDSLIMGLSDKMQLLIAIFVIILIACCIFSLIKGGHWIFLILFVILIPGGWSAAKIIAEIFWSLIKFLLIRISINF